MNNDTGSRVAFAVLAFARPVGLIECINSLRTFAVDIPIVVNIDFYIGESKDLITANLETIDAAKRLLSDGAIHSLFVSDSNLRTKRAWLWAMQNTFEKFENVVYFEDDLRVVSNVEPYISEILNMRENSSIGSIGTLFTSRLHKSYSRGVRLTKWPEFWGVVLDKTIFNQIEEFFTFDSLQFTHRVEVGLNSWVQENLGMAPASLRRRFVKIWNWKFKKAYTSEYAWDTMLHAFTWCNSIDIYGPTKELVIDTGIDFTSVSMQKKKIAVKYCKGSIPFDNGDRLNTCSYCHLYKVTQILISSLSNKHILRVRGWLKVLAGGLKLQK